jgi:hypothetical protein
MRTEKHRFTITIGNRRCSFVVREPISSGLGTHGVCWTRVRSSKSGEKEFIGLTPEEVARKATEYLLRKHILGIDKLPDLKSTPRMQLIQQLKLRDE